GSDAPTARPPLPAPAPGPDRGDARSRPPIAAAAIRVRRRSSRRARRAASPPRSPRPARGSASAQSEPSFDRFPRSERELNPYGSRQVCLSAERPDVGPLTAAGEIRQVKLRDIGDQRVRRRICVDRPIVTRPVAHLDRAVAKAIGDSLARAPGLEVEL